jgi:serine/threonine protein kinase
METYRAPERKRDSIQIVESRFSLTGEVLSNTSKSTVLLATDSQTSEKYAIKFVKNSTDNNKKNNESARRMQQEYGMVDRVSSPYLLPVIDGVLCMTSGYDPLGIVTPYIKEGNLFKHEERQWTPREFTVCALDICMGLQALHDAGIVHRDLKQENVFVREHGTAYLVGDYDFAYISPESESTSVDRITPPGFVVGTPRFVSPEQAGGSRQLTPASDLYALGLLLYEMMVGYGSSYDDMMGTKGSGMEMMRARYIGLMPDKHALHQSDLFLQLSQPSQMKLEELIYSLLQKDITHRGQIAADPLTGIVCAKSVGAYLVDCMLRTDAVRGLSKFQVYTDVLAKN